jgi:hypothetical protein
MAMETSASILKHEQPEESVPKDTPPSQPPEGQARYLDYMQTDSPYSFNVQRRSKWQMS